jgi:uncharacterized membrane protein (UPF0182 family)
VNKKGIGRMRRTPFVVFGVWAVLSILVLSIAPGVVTAIHIAPNEMTAEKPYVQHAIDMTREAYALGDVQSNEYPALESIPDADAQAAAEELALARIWTPSSLKQAFKQLETIRPYYQLSAIQPDRYEVNGRAEEVLVTAREINVKGLPKSARNWINRHLVYTHGYGLSIASATAIDESGFPEFLVGDVPPVVASEVATNSPALETTEPRIYFGQNTADWVVTGTKLDEFDHDDGARNSENRYKGTGGIVLDSFAKRLLWSVKLRTKNLLLSSYITADSQLLVTRSVNDRVAKIAPWLTLDAKPYPALVDGRIYWILDGYTSSDHFPFAKTLSKKSTNYLRNSVKAVVDAYSGDVRLYAFGDDPIRDAWAAIYPGTVTDAAQTPDALAAHFRYPTKMFNAQAQLYKTFHITDPNVYYNKEDLWGQFKDDTGSLAPSYHLLNLPGETDATYALVLPYSAPNKDNMIALLAASSNPDTYGQLTAYLLPRERITLGPQQILARIQQDPEIAPQIALWNQNGNTVIYGDMLILPVEGSITYVQPIFLKAASASITEVVGIVTVNNNQVSMGSTVTEALALANEE